MIVCNQWICRSNHHVDSKIEFKALDQGWVSDKLLHEKIAILFSDESASSAIEEHLSYTLFLINVYWLDALSFMDTCTLFPDKDNAFSIG